MSYEVKLEKFEGPLDLLLQLIESADLDITEVYLSQVADQFMKYLADVENKNPDELADFLVVASRLLLIKSRILLPNLHIEDESEAIELETQLKIYKEYHEASKKIENILAEKKALFVRKKIPLDIEVLFNPPKNLDINKLKKIFLEIIKEIEPVVKLPKKSMLRAVSIKEKIEHIRNQILSGISLSFSDLIKGSKDRTEVVVSFLGVLELVKQRHVVVKQDNMFEEITLEKYEHKESN
ncbi:MAG: segregation/condensation protein A [Patescibacteria group bacterium]